MKNSMKLEFDAFPQNEAFARMAVAAFMTESDPTIEQLEDVKTAVSEAVTNCIIHGYEMMGEKLADCEQGRLLPVPKVYLEMSVENDLIQISVRDEGVGINDIPKAMEPLYTSKPELERSGMGFAFMEAFMDKLRVESQPGHGTRVFLEKSLAGDGEE